MAANDVVYWQVGACAGIAKELQRGQSLLDLIIHSIAATRFNIG